MFIDDPSLRGPHFEKSINATLQTIHSTYVRDDPAVDLIYLIEYDQLILRADFEERAAITRRSIRRRPVRQSGKPAERLQLAALPADARGSAA